MNNSFRYENISRLLKNSALDFFGIRVVQLYRITIILAVLYVLQPSLSLQLHSNGIEMIFLILRHSANSHDFHLARNKSQIGEIRLEIDSSCYANGHYLGSFRWKLVRAQEP